MENDIIELLESEIESIIEETEIQTIGPYDDYVAEPYFLPEVATKENGEIYFYDDSMKYLDDMANNGELTPVSILYAQYLQQKTISHQIISINVLLIAILAIVLIGSAFRR